MTCLRANKDHIHGELATTYHAQRSSNFSDVEDVVPHGLTAPEIKEYVQLYSKAASYAIEAGFNSVEIHAASGYLLDQFLQTVSDGRTDGRTDGRIWWICRKPCPFPY